MAADLSIQAALQAPFPLADVQWRIQRSGTTGRGNPYALVLAYIDARAVQERLDLVFG